MEPRHVILLIAVLAAIDLPVLLLVWMMIRRNRMMAEMSAELAAGGSTVLAPPQGGSYRGAKFLHTRVRCDGVIAATDRQVIFRKLIGSPLTIDLADVTDVTLEKWFLGRWRWRMRHLVVHTREGNEIGFYVKDPEAWAALLKKAAGRT